jgi:hypothetical protein
VNTWTARLPIAFPATLITEANALAQIIDPDSGGQFTFSLDYKRGGYVITDMPVKEHFLSVIQARDPATWQAVIPALAAEKGLEAPTPEIIEQLRAALLIGDEIPGDDAP